MKEWLSDTWSRATNFYRCRSMWRRVKRFIAWFPVIWNDEDWDHAYLYEIMRFKIYRLQLDMQRNSRHTTVDHDIHQMKIVQELLKRHALDDFYWENAEKNKELCTCKEEDHKNIINEDGSWRNPFCDWCRLVSRMRLNDKKENEDFALIWKIMEKHSRCWWN